MDTLTERESAEKLRSAREAGQITTELLVTRARVARYDAPPETTVFPLEYAYHLLGDVRGKTVLEYGCGDGLNTVVLANRGAKIIALDISSELIAVAKKRLELNGCETARFLIASAHKLPLPDESVDIVFGMAILHHLDLKLASREIQRVLKKGGRGIFKEPLRNSKLLARLRQFFPTHGDVSPFERPLTKREIKDFASTFRYRARTFGLPQSGIADVLPFWRGRAVQFCAHVDSHVLQLLPSLAYYGTVEVFEITKDTQKH